MLRCCWYNTFFISSLQDSWPSPFGEGVLTGPGKDFVANRIPVGLTSVLSTWWPVDLGTSLWPRAGLLAFDRPIADLLCRRSCTSYKRITRWKCESAPLTGGCSEGLDAFIFFFKQKDSKEVLHLPTTCFSLPCTTLDCLVYSTLLYFQVNIIVNSQ